MLMYPNSASCVKCSVCHFVTPVGSRPPAGSGPSGSSRPGPAAQGPPQPAKPIQTVVIENPPSLDEHGNEVRYVVNFLQNLLLLHPDTSTLFSLNPINRGLVTSFMVFISQVTNIAVGVKSENQ